MDAIVYRLRNGCTWRALPHDFPPWTVVYFHFKSWRKSDAFKTLNTNLRRQLRAKTPKASQPVGPVEQSSLFHSDIQTGPASATSASSSSRVTGTLANQSLESLNLKNEPGSTPEGTLGDSTVEVEYRSPEPSVAVIDSQSVKGTPLTENGYDGNKKVNGRKRHIAVDVLGIILFVVVTTANVQDRDGFTLLTRDIREELPRVECILVDGVYNGTPIREFEERNQTIRVETRDKTPNQSGFVPIRQRWVVERTFGWLVWDRLLSKCVDRLPKSEESFTFLASARRCARKLGSLQT
jgi:transposase